MAKTINGDAQLHALVDGKEIIITESSNRRDLQLADEEGIDCLPNSTIFEQLTLMGKPKRKDTQVPQPSDPIKDVPDEAVHMELGDSLVMAVTTASRLEAKQDNGGTTAQTRFKSVSKHFNDSLLARGNTLRSNKNNLKLDELMALCTTLQNRVLDLEKTTTTQHNEIPSLKMRVKELEKKNRSKTDRLKRLYKVGLMARENPLVVSNDADKEMFDVDALDGEEVFVAEHEVVVKGVNDEVNVVEEVAEVINTTKQIIDVAQNSAAGDIVSTVSAAKTIDVGKAVWNVIRVYAGDSKLMLLGITYYCWVNVNAVEARDPIENVADEAVHKQLGDSLVRAATTASSLEAEVLDLEKTTTTQRNEIASLKRKVKKHEKKNRSRTDRLKRLYKVSLTAKVESFGNKESLDEDASKQGRIDAIDADEEITLVSVQDKFGSNDADKGMFNVDVLDDSAAGDIVSTASATTTVSAATTTAATIKTIDDITLAQALEEIKSTKPKEKGIVIQELGESTTTKSSQQSQDKGKGILIKPVIESAKPMKRKDQIKLDEEAALKLQAIFYEKERLAREKAEKVEKANIALIETWDDMQAKIIVDHQLAERMQAQEQEELSIAEKATLFQQLLEKRRKHFAAKRAEEKRNKPPTKLNRER
nr:hypothetical protein [Tanacetum cinerariifolium]